MVESPNWLLSKGRLTKAKKCFNYLRGESYDENISAPAVLEEWEKITLMYLEKKEEKINIFKIWKLPQVYKPFFIILGILECNYLNLYTFKIFAGLFTFQQLSGIFVIIVYAVQIATTTGVSIDPYLCAIWVGFIRFATTIALGYIFDRLGIRFAALLSTTAMTACLLLLTTHEAFSWWQNDTITPLVALLSYILFSSLGLFTLPFYLNGELFPQKLKGPCSGISSAYGMVLSSVVVKIYIPLKNLMGHRWIFAIFTISAFVAIFYEYFFLPETKGRPLWEIENDFNSEKSVVSIARQKYKKNIENDKTTEK